MSLFTETTKFSYNDAPKTTGVYVYVLPHMRYKSLLVSYS